MRRLFSFLIVTAILFVACNHQQFKKIDTKPKAGNICDSCCLKKLALFADKLHINPRENFAYTFDEKHFSLGNCDLKRYRGNPSLKSSLVLIWLKLDQVYLINRWPYAYIQDVGGNSKAAYQVVFEFYFLTTGDSPRWIEYMEADWVNKVIESDNSLLKNEQIKRLFNENHLLKIRNKHKKKKPSSSE